jgi:hypothetical protein
LTAGASHALAQYAGKACDSQVDVLTHRNNNYRTGANLQETCLTWNSLKGESFGKLFTLGVQGQVYAQPLIVTNLQIYNQAHAAIEFHNVVFIATMENWVYAFDADGGNPGDDGAPRPLWSSQLGPPLAVSRIPKDIGALLNRFNIDPVVGITSTPVIDRSVNTLFLVAKIARKIPVEVDCGGQVATPQCPVENWVFALDIQTGEMRDTVKIQLPPPEEEQTDPRNEKPCRGYPDQRHPTEMDAARINLQRPALLLTGSPGSSSKHIYLGFGSHQDAPCPMYHGMLVRIDYDTAAPKLKLTQFHPDNPFLVTKAGETDPIILWFFHDQSKLGKGGIWQAGNGPAADAEGNVYVMTGNGTFKPGQEYGSNFLRLNPDLDPQAVDWFAPSNAGLLSTDTLDVDLGSSGPVLLPGKEQVIGGGKQGKLYLLNQRNLGHQNRPIQEFWTARRWSVSFLYGWFPISLILPALATGFHHIHGSPAYWGDPSKPDSSPQGQSLYVWPERDRLKSFEYRKDSSKPEGKFELRVRGPEGAPLGMPGGFLSISANGTQDGILWAALPLHDDAWINIVRGQLRAFRIKYDGSLIEAAWTSYCADPDDRFNFAKYVPPTVANGKVYLATFSGFVAVYGPRPATPAKPANCEDVER